MIVDGVLTQTSVSEIETADENQVGGCPRRWWFDRFGDLRPDQHRSQAEGEAGHAHLAAYLSTGAMPPKRKLMSKASTGAILKDKLPKPRTPNDLLVELRFSGQPKHEDACECGHGSAAHPKGERCETVTVDGQATVPCTCTGYRPRWIPLDTRKTLHVDGVPLEGFIDLAYRRGERPAVIDHKFFSPCNPMVSDDPYHWLKRGDELLSTVQMPVYVEAMRRRWPDAREWVIAHHYVSKKGVDSLFRVAVVTTDQIDARMVEIAKLVERMKSLASATEQDQVPVASSALTPTKDACHARQGCPHQSICSAFTNRRTPAMELSADELAVFGDVPPLDAPLAEPTPIGDDVPPLDAPVAAPAPAAEPAKTHRMKFVDVPPAGAAPEPAPAATVLEVIQSQCACGEFVNENNGSKLRDGTWKHIGCKLDAPPPAQKAKRAPKKPAENPPASAATPAANPLPPKDSPRESDTDRAARQASEAMAAAANPTPAPTAPVDVPEVKPAPDAPTPLALHASIGPVSAKSSKDALADLLVNIATLIRNA